MTWCYICIMQNKKTTERIYAARFRITPYRRNGIIYQCCKCRRIEIGPGLWAYAPIPHKESVSHGLCPACLVKVKKEIVKNYETEKQNYRNEIKKALEGKNAKEK